MRIFTASQVSNLAQNQNAQLLGMLKKGANTCQVFSGIIIRQIDSTKRQQIQQLKIQKTCLSNLKTLLIKKHCYETN